MSIIYSYPEQGALNANDMLIGTSAEKVGGKQKNITRNFTIQQIADFINRGAGFVDPVASDFQIPVFNQEGKKITGSIISQNIYPNGSAITITGSLTTTGAISTVNNLTASGVVSLGSQNNLISLNSITKLGGPIKDAAGTLGNVNQILLSNGSGNVIWQNYEAGLTYEGTWDANANTTNGLSNSPALLQGVGVSGHFYIVNVEGTTSLGPNLNDWHVGDWAVFLDEGGQPASWQKIDNTSVLTGSGTANTLAMWTAAETLNDSLLSQDAGATKVIVDGLLEIKGDGTSQDGRIKLNCWNNNHGVTIQSPPHSAAQSWTWILPQTTGGANDVLTTDGNTPSQLSWTTPTAPVTGTGTQNYVTKWSAGGTGIEDSTIFDNGTNVGIGTTSPAEKLYVNSTSGDARIGLNAPTGSDTEIKFSNAGVVQYSIGHDDATDNFVIGTANVDTPKVSISKAGNVGIGTTSPLAKLHVHEAVSGQSSPNSAADTLVLEGSSSAGVSILNTNSGVGSIFFGDNNDNFIGGFRYNHSNNSLETYANNAVAIAIDSSRNVGIGTTSPTRQLTVNGTNSSSININSNVSNGVSLLAFGDSDDDNYAQIILDNSTNKLQIQNGGGGGISNRGLTLDSSQNVGIGTSSPAVSLDISATDAVQMPVGDTGDRPTGVDGMLRYNSTNNGFEGYINGNWGSIGGGSSGGLVFRGTFDASTGAIASGGSLYTCPAGGSGGTVDTAIGDLYIVTTAGSFFCSGTSLNIGDEVICTTAALAGFDDVNNWNAVASGSGGAITGSGTANYIPKFTANTVVSDSSIFNNASGKVGINRIPAAGALSLEVMAPSGYSLGAGFHSPSTQSTIEFKDANTTANFKVRIGSETDDMLMFAGGSERMRVDSNGNVGIGTTSPLVRTQISTTLSSGSVQDALLLSQNTSTSTSGQGVKMYLSSSNSISRAAAIEAIAGSSNDHSLGFYTNSAFSNPTERMLIDSAGKVGIGTSQPEVSLDLSAKNDAVSLPAGDNTARGNISNPLPGMIRYNNSANEFEGYSGTLGVSGSWGALGGGSLPTKTVDTFTGSGQSFIDLTVEASSKNYIDMYIDGVYQAKATYNITTVGVISRITLASGTFPTGVSIETVTTT